MTKITVNISKTNFSRLMAKTHTWADVLRLEGRTIETVIAPGGVVTEAVREADGSIRPLSEYVVGKVQKRGPILRTTEGGRRDTVKYKPDTKGRSYVL